MDPPCCGWPRLAVAGARAPPRAYAWKGGGVPPEGAATDWVATNEQGGPLRVGVRLVHASFEFYLKNSSERRNTVQDP